MYEELFETIPDTEAYLRFLGLEKVSVSREDLDRLINAHGLSVPFESLEAFPGRRIPPLGIRENFERVVYGHRGGYCFQLNGLFCALLQALGFDAYSVSAKIIRGPMRPSPFTHRAVIVTLEGKKYFCDVGMGGPSPTFSLPLDDPSFHRQFCIRPMADGLVLLKEDAPEEPILWFRDLPADPAEFLTGNLWCSMGPESHFGRQVVVNRRTKAGRRSLTGETLHICENGEEMTLTVQPEELSRVLWEYFGIKY